MTSSLPPGPSDRAPYQPIKPSPARPTSVLRHAAYRAHEEAMMAESSTSHRRRRSTNVLDSPNRQDLATSRPLKRVRAATPICDESAGTELVNVQASTAPAQTNKMADTSGQYIGDDVRCDRQAIETSEKDEPSVLFSERGGTRTEPTEAMEGGSLLDEQDQEENTMVETLDDKSASPQLSPSLAAVVDEDIGAYVQDDGVEEEDYADLPWMLNQPDTRVVGEDYSPPRTREEAWQRYMQKVINGENPVAGDGDRFFPPSPIRVQTTRELYLQAQEAGEEIEYHSGDSEEFEMDHRPVLERAGVKRDIRAFVDSMDLLSEPNEVKRDYQIVDRLGEGTFSSVYLAYDRRHGKYNNDWWTGEEDQASHESFKSHRHTVKLALKRVLATSSPQRIENELDILESLRGCRNVSQLVTAFRQEDQVIIVLPYHQSDDFRHFYRHMDADHTRMYMRALLRGLADIHARGIMHRDIKPANFLFDYETGQGVICDFGLAERYSPPRKSACQHGPATLGSLAGKLAKTADTPTVEQALYDARKRSRLGEGRIGFPQDDKRPAIKTNRAGTRGFRAPEVLLKCPDQTVAIDVWSAGVMLLSILTHKFPVFNSTDDLEALMEIAAIFGRQSMERCAMLHNRTIMTNCPTVDNAPASLRELILTINPHLYTPPMTAPTPAQAQDHIEAMDFAMDLCSKLLRLDATKRISAKRALNSEFFSTVPGYEEESSEPLLGGDEGKCGHLHSIADNKHQAWFYRDCQEMQFGQGIPPAADKLCPEHEHWQQRTLLNPVSLSHHFTEPDAGSAVADDDELIVERPVFSVKDTNVPVEAALNRPVRTKA